MIAVEVRGLKRMERGVSFTVNNKSKNVRRKIKSALSRSGNILDTKIKQEIIRLRLIKTGMYIGSVKKDRVIESPRDVFSIRIHNLARHAEYLESRRNWYKGYPQGFRVYTRILRENRKTITDLFKAIR